MDRCASDSHGQKTHIQSPLASPGSALIADDRTFPKFRRTGRADNRYGSQHIGDGWVSGSIRIPFRPDEHRRARRYRTRSDSIRPGVPHCSVTHKPQCRHLIAEAQRMAAGGKRHRNNRRRFGRGRGHIGRRNADVNIV